MIRVFPHNLRLRITLYFSLVFGIITAVPAFVTYEHLKSDLYLHVDRDLHEKMRYVIHVLDHLDSKDASREFLTGVFSGKTLVGDYLHYVQAIDRSNRILVINTHKDIENFAVKAASRSENPCDIRIGKSEFRVYRQRHADQDIYVATSIELILRGLHSIRITYLIAFPAAVLISSFLVFLIATRALGPILDATRRAEGIAAHNLQERLESPKYPDEAGTLVRTFNRMIARLEDSFGRITRFTADAAHELHTPLTILRGELEVALRDSQMTGDLRKIIRSNLDEVNRLTGIVGDLFRISRTDNQDIGEDFVAVELDNLLEDLYERFQVLTREKNIEFAYECNEPVTVKGDPYRLIQLFLNLLNNAVRYTPQGGNIQLICGRNGRNARIVVADTGIGIAAGHRERIFDRFYRVNRARNRGDGGTGLGLAIAKWIVNLHKGEIHVESTLGRGSSFEVLLPLQEESGT